MWHTAVGGASVCNLFSENESFCTHKCPQLVTKRVTKRGVSSLQRKLHTALRGQRGGQRGGQRARSRNSIGHLGGRRSEQHAELGESRVLRETKARENVIDVAGVGSELLRAEVGESADA
jgi:hypothetical protein